MDIVFIHGNYPAQFRHLISLLAKDKSHNIIFITARQDANNDAIEGLNIKIFTIHRQANQHTHHYLIATEEAVIQGQAIIRALAELIDSGFNPRLIICHGGMGLGLFIKDILPNCLLVGYFEWYFQKETAKYLVDKYDTDVQLRLSMRNMPILQELEKCDLAIVPSDWQRSQFPDVYQSKMKVIFDGIDTSFFHTKSDYPNIKLNDLVISNRDDGTKFLIESNHKVISYATRGMEPLRGFPEFMQALPSLLKIHKDLIVIIAGADRRAYSYDAPTHNGSWKEYMLAKLGDFIGRDRIYFTGLLTYEDYRSLLWRTDLHCYFTRPFVTSWSLFEAASCGATLAVNRCLATDGIVEPSSVYWVNLNESDELIDELSSALYNPKSSIINKGYDLTSCLVKWQSLINRSLLGQNQA